MPSTACQNYIRTRIFPIREAFLFQSLVHLSLDMPTYKYGFAIDTFKMYQSEIKPNAFLADILLAHQVEYVTIDKIAKKSRDTFDVRKIRAGKPFTILYSNPDSSADYFIYEPSAYEYVVFELKDSLDISVIERPYHYRNQNCCRYRQNIPVEYDDGSGLEF